MSEEFKGKMKEAYGAMTGDEDKKAEGQAQQRPRGRRGRRREPAKSRPRKRRGSVTGRHARTRAY